MEIDLHNLLSLLTSRGWNVSKDSVCLGYHFDYVCERSYPLYEGYIIFRFVDSLDLHTSKEVKRVFSDIRERAKSWILSRCFIFCIIADVIDQDVMSDFERESLFSFGVFRLRFGGGIIFLVDLQNKKIYGKVPIIPYDIHK